MAENEVKKPTREDLMLGDELESALLEAAQLKRTVMTTCKDREKTTYDRFYETTLMARPDVQAVFDKKKKNRDDADNELIKQFKKQTSKTYKQVCEYLLPEKLEDGQMTKFEKLADKVASIAQVLDYLGDSRLADAFGARGLSIGMTKLEDTHENYKVDAVRDNIVDIFKTGQKIRQDVSQTTDMIKEKIYAAKVPLELQFEKQNNPLGIKPADWSKLVDIRTKLLEAADDKDKSQKVEDQASDLAGDKQFEIERARLVQKKLMTMQAEEPLSAESNENSESSEDA